MSGDAEPIVRHALEAFGSEEKAWHWLESANPLFDGNTPIEILRTDRSRYELVDDERVLSASLRDEGRAWQLGSKSRLEATGNEPKRDCNNC